MHVTERAAVEKLIQAIVEQNISAEGKKWLKEKIAVVQSELNGAALYTTFALIPRKTGHQPIEVSEKMQDELSEAIPGFSLEGCTADRLCRQWLLMNIPQADKAQYIGKIETLFQAAEMNELAALYASLPLFSYSEDWKNRCAEGIRSNIGIVLEAIMYYNPYPATHLDDKAWNQLVLKAFFTDKDVKKIVGLDERVNKELSDTLLDYASERWSAGRTVNPQLWRLVSKFIDASSVQYFEKLFASNDPVERNAAALACHQSPYQPAKQLAMQQPEFETQWHNHNLNWNNIHS